MANQVALRQTVDVLVEKIGEAKISCQEEYDVGMMYIKQIADVIKQVDAEFEEDRVKTKAAYDAVLEDRRVFKKPLEAVDKAIRAKMSEYATAQEKIRQEALRKEKEEAALRLAEEQKAMGRAEEAEKTLARPETVKLMNEPPKVGKTVEAWKATVVNINEFVLSVAADAQHGEEITPYIDVDEVAIAKYFRIHGIREYAGLKIEVVQRPVL